MMMTVANAEIVLWRVVLSESSVAVRRSVIVQLELWQAELTSGEGEKG